MKIKRVEFTSDGHGVVAYFVYCPACERAHRFITNNGVDPKHVWSFDGNLENPTFEPSLLVTGGFEGSEVCHSYLRGGVWEFLSDSTHGVTGKVKMVDFPDGYRV